jgi:hypothetical protein
MTSGWPPTSSLKNFSRLPKTLYGPWYSGDKGGTVPPFRTYTNSARCSAWRPDAALAQVRGLVARGCVLCRCSGHLLPASLARNASLVSTRKQLVDDVDQ